MWPIVVIFVLVCGYHYINSDIPSKSELKKAQGWNAYFQVALKGSEFLIGGAVLAIAIQVVFYGAMLILNLLYYMGIDYSKFTFADDLNNWRFITFSYFSWLVAICTILICIGQASEAKKRNNNLDLRFKLIEALSQKDSIKKLLLESIDLGFLIMVTLKSRKIYVGIVDNEKFFNLSTHADDSFSIIPFLSGYRDKYTLSFVEDCNYTLIYDEKDISFESMPLSFQQFRHIIPISEIECISLFDSETYLLFKDKQDISLESINKNP